MAYKNNYIKISKIFTNNKSSRKNWVKFIQLSIINVNP